VLADGGGGPPHRGVAFRRDGEVTAQPDRGVGEFGGEVPGVGAHHRAVGVAEPGPHRVWEGGHRPGQQPAAVGADVLHPGEQVAGQGEPGVRPGARCGRPARWPR